MNTFQAALMGMASRGNTMKVFDWHKAARLIREHKPSHVVAGLSSDMEWTSGEIYSSGGSVGGEDTYTYLASTWATPVIVMDHGEEIPCYIMDTEDENPEGWGAGTYWPKTSLEILNNED